VYALVGPDCVTGGTGDTAASTSIVTVDADIDDQQR
jgi:hypothetical protein